VSPTYQQDKIILAGSSNDGSVYWSNNDASVFEQLGQQLPQLMSEAGVANDVTVAFDPQFDTNRTTYAASHCSKGAEHSSAIYRFIIGTSTEWESIDTALAVGSMLSQLAVSADSTLYSANFKADGGMERCLNPTYRQSPAFETVTSGLSDGATLTGLWLSGNRVWSIDSRNNRLMTYVDNLARPVILMSPHD
jgi:hypothetical protein